MKTSVFQHKMNSGIACACGGALIVAVAFGHCWAGIGALVAGIFGFVSTKH